MLTKISFRTRLQLILLAMSGASLAVLIVMAGQSSKAFRTGKDTQVKAAADTLIDKIDRNLFERYGDVQAYALSEPARSMDSARITAFINDMMQTYAPIYDLMLVTNKNGRVISVSTVGKDGKALHSESLLGADLSGAPWFKAAIRNEIKAGTSFVEDLDVDKDVARIVGTNGRVMNFSAPIRDKNTGEVLGVWSNRMSWTDVVEAISKEEGAKLKNELVVAALPYIIDAKGRYLVHPDGEAFELSKNFPRVGQPPEVREIASTSSSYTGNLLESVSLSKGYSSYPGRSWSAIVQIPAEDSQSAANRSLTIFGISLVVSVNLLGAWIIRRISRRFEAAVGRMVLESSKVKTAANQITTASQQLSEATTEQAAAIEETAASMEEMSSMLSQTTQHASQCMGVADDGQQEAAKGKQVIVKMTSAMEEVQAANSKLDRLVNMIEDIKLKTRVINDIVFETRLLSFNASIEAARAGAHGKGFAVVAEEVGKLASMSGKAADEIHTLLDSSTQEVVQVVKSTQERVNLGKSVSHECEVAFGSMGSTLEKISEAVRSITAAAREQETGVKQTNRAMSEMDKITHINSKGAETLADQANKLYAGSASLDQVIQEISETMFGKGAVKASTAPIDSPPGQNSGSTTAVFTYGEVMPVDHNRGVTRSDKRWKSAA